MTRHVRDEWRDEELHELIADAEAVASMLESRGWKAVQRVLGAEVATIDGELDHGRAKEASDYAKQHGRRSALGAAEDAAMAIVSQAASRRKAAEEAEAAKQSEVAGESAAERVGV